MLKIRGLTVIKYVLSAALSITLLAAVKSQAATAFPTMTQLELIQWLVQLKGDTKSIPANAQAPAYVEWATAQGVIPAGGWQPTAVLTRDVLAQALVQYFNLHVKPGGDIIKALQREGIDLPGLTSTSEITRKDWVSLVDTDGLQPRSSVLVTKGQTGNQPPDWSNGEPPKKNGRHDNGNHYGQDNGNGNGNVGNQKPIVRPK